MTYTDSQGTDDKRIPVLLFYLIQEIILQDEGGIGKFFLKIPIDF